AWVVSTQMREKIRENREELVGGEERKELMDDVKESYGVLVDEVRGNGVGVGDIEKVLGKVLKEKVCIGNVVTIFELVGE
ncbi:FHIPEP family type III secretion protein, partial [Bacillus pumilus]|uniref:FHIPEP family type III secretion protein n=1 Tax=Bacillus pumilus TaxID=1408 RepID=UPI0011A96995